MHTHQLGDYRARHRVNIGAQPANAKSSVLAQVNHNRHVVDHGVLGAQGRNGGQALGQPVFSFLIFFHPGHGQVCAQADTDLHKFGVLGAARPKQRPAHFGVAHNGLNGRVLLFTHFAFVSKYLLNMFLGFFN